MAQQALLDSQLELLIVQPSTVDAEQLSSDQLDGLRKGQRTHLHYDEVITALLIVRAPLGADDLLASLIHSQLGITCHLTALLPQEASRATVSASRQATELVLDDVSIPQLDPHLIPTGNPDVSVAVVAVDLHLQHPERLLVGPTVHLAATLTVVVPSGNQVDPLDDYLPSGIPSKDDILAPIVLAAGLSLDDVDDSLTREQDPGQRRTLNARQTDTRILQASTSPFSITPAVLLRTSRTLFSTHVFFTLEVQIPEKSNATIVSYECLLPSSSAQPLSKISLPATMQANDRTTLIFQSNTENRTSVAQFRLQATSTFADGTIGRLTIGRTLDAPPPDRLPSRQTIKHWANPRGNLSRPNNTIPSNTSPNGIKLITSAPSRVSTHSDFPVTFFVLNQSSRRRRLAILGPPPGGSKPIVKSSWVVANDDDSIATTVLDSRTLYAQAIASRGLEKRRGGAGRQGGAAGTAMYRADVVALDTEVKVGPLAAGACQAVIMQMRAFGVGVVNLEGIVVVDLDSRETCLVGQGWEGICTNDAESSLP